MGILIAFAVVLCACYSPDVRDCTRACESNADCVAAQACNADHMCAAPSITSCAEPPMVDAPLADAPAQTVHHDAAIDAAIPIATLQIHIDGPGEVDTPVGNCTMSDCTLHAAPNVALTLTAVAHQDKMFMSWTTPACMGQLAMCHLTPAVGITMVSAKFH